MSYGFDFVYMRALEGSFQDSTSEAIHLMKVFNLPGGCIVAGAAIICAGLAGINPMEIVKRNALPTIVAVVVVTVAMFI